MKAKVIREGFIGGRLARPGEVIEVSKPGSWYEPLADVKPAEPKASKAPKGASDKGAADAAAALT